MISLFLKCIPLISGRIVPTGVSRVFVNATGAQGGNSSSLGGRGGWVQASLSVTAGQKLYILVRGDTPIGVEHDGDRESGWLDGLGGGGGGATDIRTYPGDRTSRLLVAGGGGGGTSSDRGGNGGSFFSLYQRLFGVLQTFSSVNLLHSMAIFPTTIRRRNGGRIFFRK